MNTEIIDYIRSLSKKEFFYVSVADLIFSITILVCGFIAFQYGSSLYTHMIMFGCATALMGCNSYKCFKRGSKNGWVFAGLGVVFAATTAMSIYFIVN